MLQIINQEVLSLEPLEVKQDKIQSNSDKEEQKMLKKYVESALEINIKEDIFSMDVPKDFKAKAY